MSRLTTPIFNGITTDDIIGNLGEDLHCDSLTDESTTLEDKDTHLQPIRTDGTMEGPPIDGAGVTVIQDDLASPVNIQV